MSKQLDRRGFLAKSTASALAASFLSKSGTVAASDTVRVAVVGLNGRGKAHIRGFHRQPGVQLAALCDCDESVLERVAGQYEAH